MGLLFGQLVEISGEGAIIWGRLGDANKFFSTQHNPITLSVTYQTSNETRLQHVEGDWPHAR